jgi:hypothetical protein
LREKRKKEAEKAAQLQQQQSKPADNKEKPVEQAQDE